MGQEEDNNYYNKVFKNSIVYHQPWDKVNPSYKILWEKSIDLLHQNNVKNILDIGSGMGHMGDLAHKHNIKYKGIDFSEYAIQYSQDKAKGSQIYECVDALKYHYNDEVGGYTSHEFLEHIEGDLQVLSNLKSNKFILFSVPNFDYPGHVRWFLSEEEVVSRYSPYIKNLQVKKLTPQHYLGWGITQ